ncbi:MAG: 3'-5' exonuclease [Burkholderiales bacterium]
MPPEYLRQISREEMNALPIRRYEGAVHLVESEHMLERAAADILQERAVGFDTETRPAFRKGESHLPSLAQVATARAVYLFALQRLDCSGLLARMLGAPHIVNAGVALADDLRQLKQLFAFEAAAVLDLGQVAHRHGLKQTGLRNLTGIFLGTRIPKGTKTTNWAARHLTPQQVTYAATDAWACRELYLRFQALGLL